MEKEEGKEAEFSEEQVEYWMRLALQQAQKGVKNDEIPVGCIFIRRINDKYEKIVGSHNLTNQHKNASRHCEINCINYMQGKMTAEEISTCILFVTVQPCIMCTFALNLMGIRMAYFGQFNDKFGGCGSLRKDNKFQIRGGVLQKQSFEIIKNFYERGNQKLPEEMRNRSRKRVKLIEQK